MKNLADYFYEAAELFPEKIAIWCDDDSLTYKRLSELVSKYSNFLLKSGVSYKDHIGIPMNNSITSVALMLAAANIGAVLVPMNPTLPLNAIHAAFNSAKVKHLIARRAFFEEHEESDSLAIDGIKICMDKEYPGTVSLQTALKFSAVRPVCSNITGDEIFIITMTSGSTGSPKPIMLTQNSKLLRAQAHIKLYRITKEDNVLAATPLYHSLAERLVLIPLILGGTSIILPRFSVKLWMDCIRDQLVTFTIAVSAQLSQIAIQLSADDNIVIEHLRCLVSSSSLLEASVKKQLIAKLQCDFYEMYGTSETSTITSINFKEATNKHNSVGKSLQEAEVIILKDNEELCAVGEIGEIACKTQLICDGYFGNHESFNKALSNNYFKTGDLGYLDADGYLYFSGRKKELIITGGINVYPVDIEKCLSELKEIEECAAFAYPDERLGEIVAVAIVLKKDTDLSKRAIQLHCARQLADFQQPHKIFFLDELPKNTLGKVVKGKIIEYFQDNNLLV